jgi:sigma-B regulation protein RsbU (phosphoserine phosphatase)
MNAPVSLPQIPVRGSGSLAFLAELSQALALSLDLDTTLQQTVDRVLDFMQAEAASLFLVDDNGGAPMIECRICAGPIDVRGLRLALGQGVVGRAVAENRIQLVADAASDPRVWRGVDQAAGFLTRSLVCAPRATAAGPIGALEIINRRDGQPFGGEDGELLGVIAAPAALAINNARMARRLVEQQRLRREFELARRLQRSLLPRRRRGGFPIVAVNRPAHEVSGDFYDHFELADGRIGFVAGDVSGKGMDAALLMVRAASLLRWIGKEGLAPAAWLARAHEELSIGAPHGRFVCALVGWCEPATMQVAFAAAGFPPVLVEQDGAVREYRAGGPPLGILAEARFEETCVPLGQGTLFAFSDGVTDVRGEDGAPLGLAGVRGLLARGRGKAPAARLRGVLAALRRHGLVDDTTLLAVAAPGAPAGNVLLERWIAADAAQLRGLRCALRDALGAIGMAEPERERLVLAVDEACANIIRHGYGGEAREGIGLRLRRDGARLVIELTDQAPCADPARLKPQPLGECRAGGFGLALIDAVVDDWRLESGPGGRGNRLVLEKHIAGTGPAEQGE